MRLTGEGTAAGNCKCAAWSPHNLEALLGGRQVDVRAVSSGGCQAGSRAFMQA